MHSFNGCSRVRVWLYVMFCASHWGDTARNEAGKVLDLREPLFSWETEME